MIDCNAFRLCLGVATIMAALNVAAQPAAATAAEVDEAVATYKGIKADTSKLKAYCTMMSSTGDALRYMTSDKAKFMAANKKAEESANALGPDFVKAQGLVARVLPDSDEGKRFMQAKIDVDAACKKS